MSPHLTLLAPMLAAAERPGWFVRSAEAAAAFIEGIGIVIVVIGGVAALGRYLGATLRSADRDRSYQRLRRSLGRSILLGLEFLVAADIISTVLVTPTLRSAATLGLIVIIRTFLSWSLELEIEGRWPWQKASPTDAPAPERPERSDPVGRA
jgi:uncharacterized membrane protein